MAIDKLIPQYLSSDTDQKLVKSVEMTDNLNIRVSNDDEGTAGVVKNIKGTEVVGAKNASDVYPDGDNRVVGSVANEKNKEILFLLWNSFNNHGIYRLDMTSGKYQKLYEDSVLNFRKFSYADCDVVVNDKDETLLFFTDGINPPMKVNVQRLISGDYPSSLTTGTDYQKLLSLTVAKQPPLQAPTYNVKNNPNVEGESRIKSSNYQFAYKYVYKDGEHSALSPYSSLTLSNAQLVDGYNTDDQKNFFNQIDVNVNTSVGDVEKILVYARRINGEFFEIAELENSNSSTTKKVEFTDNIIGTYLSQDEQNKIYDNVPQRAKAQTIAANRLMYGSYEEGYDNIDVDAELTPNYHAQPTIYDLTVTVSNYGGNGSYRDFRIDYTDIPASVTSDSKLMLNFFIDFEDVLIAGDTTEHISLGSGELNVIYRHKTDNTDRRLKSFGVSSIRGIGSVSNVLNAIWGTLTGVGPNFDPGITMTTEGLQVKELIDVPSGTTKQAIRNLVESRLESKEYTIFLNPSNGERRFSTLNTGGSTPFNIESASFKGSMRVEIDKFSGGSNVDTYRLKGKSAELQIHEFTDSAGRVTEIVRTNKIRLDSTNERFFFVDATLLVGSCSLFTKLTGDRAFKSGASHELGIVYYDDRGRTSGVQEIGDTYVKHLNDRSDENDLDGKSSIVMRIKHNAPSWARRWMPVYTGKGNIDLKFQYGVKGAFIPTNNIERSTVFSSEENIYISLNSLFNKEGSYTKSSKALIDYKFEEGDRLRVIKYGDDQRTTYEFNVVDYVTLVDDDTSNPILRKITENAKDATTGDFLVIKDNPNATNFNYDAVAKNTSKWFEDCIVEVYKDLKDREEVVYYEIGKSYSINSGTHDDERTATTFSATVASNSNGIAKVTGSTVKVFKGDIIQTGSSFLTVGNVYQNGTTYTFYAIDKNVTPLAVGSYNFTVTNPDTVIDLSLGDIYFRVRSCIVSTSQINTLTFTNLSSQNSKTEFIEDYSVSDFFKSKRTSIGRPFAYIPEARTMHRKATITYSDAYLIDSDRMNLSSFNLSLANWLDLDITNGSVQSLINRNEALTVIQQNKACQIPVNRNLIEYAGGGSNLAVSRNVLGNPSYYAGNFGTSNPESVVSRFGVVYYADATAGKIIRLSADGITPISEKGMDSFFENKFKNLIANTEKVRVVGGFDPDNDEYIVTVEPVFSSSLTIGTDVSDIPVDADAEFTIQGITYTSQTVLWNIWGNVWNTFCGDWDEVGNGVVFVDSVFTPQSILVDSSYLGSTATIDILVTNSSYSFSAIGQLNLSNGQLTLPSTTCEGDSITIGSATEVETGFTIAYKHKDGRWGSKYSFKPTNYVNINNELYSFFETDSGIMWKHNVNDTRNNFYGTQYDSELEVVANFNPSMIKVYEAMGIEGNGSWSGTLTTSDQSTTIGTSDFDTREGHRYAMIPRDTLKSTGHQIYLGKVATSGVSGDKVTFTTPINKIPFVVGDILKTASGSTLTGTGAEISGIDGRKTIQCVATVSNISDGDDIFVEHTSRVDGDPMRDVFLKIKLTSSDTAAFEVHGISVSYDRSRLHNDRVN